jgi:hypothetical protein
MDYVMWGLPVENAVRDNLGIRERHEGRVLENFCHALHGDQKLCVVDGQIKRVRRRAGRESSVVVKCGDLESLLVDGVGGGVNERN